LNVSLIVNPSAGNKAHRSIHEIESLLSRAAALKTFVTSKRGDAFEFAKKSCDADRIIVSGGDGTFNEALNGLLSAENISLAGIPLALIPTGTANVLAKELKIPQDIKKATELAFTGTARKIALGRINGRYFTLMAGIGFDGETVLNVKRNLLKKISGNLAHIAAGLKVLTKYDPSLIKIKTPVCELTGYVAVIGNARNYGGHFSVTPHACITEPLLDICVFKGRSRRDLLRFIIGVLRREHLTFDDVSYFKATEAEIVSDDKVHVQTDGDYFGTLPVRIDVVQDAVSIIY
jgi:YegS/Rv2252/BmrU family lipid kinase